uniref:Uncharacterized protein n=1 Tax=Ciona savignyi TaxID=51511 RepID=H2YMD0_CIOSA
MSKIMNIGLSEEQKNLLQQLKEAVKKNENLQYVDKKLKCRFCHKEFSGPNSFIKGLIHLDGEHNGLLKESQVLKDSDAQTDTVPTCDQSCTFPSPSREIANKMVETKNPAEKQKSPKPVVPIPEKMQRYIGYSRRNDPVYAYSCRLCEERIRNIKMAVVHLIKTHNTPLKGNQDDEVKSNTPKKPVAKQTARKRINSCSKTAFIQKNRDNLLNSNGAAFLKPLYDAEQGKSVNSSQLTEDLTNLPNRTQLTEDATKVLTEPKGTLTKPTTSNKEHVWEYIQKVHKRHSSGDSQQPLKLCRTLTNPEKHETHEKVAATASLPARSCDVPKRKAARKTTRPNKPSPSSTTANSAPIYKLFESTGSSKQFLTDLPPIVPSPVKAQSVAPYEPGKIVRT